ncbi:LysR family transcriptional regulator [Salinimonas chungwhensis]|uniref:LysR family transcriptional regulator n=1 Tax=Salinimonas chungwhensis TaxID=265425 RepID=UPI000373039F|nr:LysR family transcriptional regulator [Salinimonas chungwhensis]
MHQLNYRHLYYFYLTAKLGSIASAAKTLHVTPQTVSGLLSTFEAQCGQPLFDRIGKRLQPNAMGKQVYQHAQEIFKKGNELAELLRSGDAQTSNEYTVGLTDAIPKVLAYEFIHQTMLANPKVRFVFKEGLFDDLLSEMAVNRIDIVLADRGVAPGAAVSAVGHSLGTSAVSFFASMPLANRLKAEFPDSLNQAAMLMPGVRSGIAFGLSAWLEDRQLFPKQVAEFDDSALLKLFGAEGFGVFCAPSCIAEHVEQQYQVRWIGQADTLQEHFFALTRHNQTNTTIARQIIDHATALLAAPAR